MLIPELDKKLSKPAGKIVSVLSGAAIAWAAYETIMEGPLSLPISAFQAEYLFNGSYFPVLTILALSAPLCIPAYALGFAWDYINDQGTFANDAQELSNQPPEIAEQQA